jgi:hypothetical protein
MIRALIIALVLALAVGGLQTWRLDRVKHELSLSREQVKALAARLDAEDRDAQTQATQCDAREAHARQSAQTIKRIITRTVHVDPRGCAVRELVPADELRDALPPGSQPAPARPLH